VIKAIIFDCFGVLTTDSWTPFKRRHFGHDPALMEEVSEKFRLVDAGLAHYDDFLTEIAKLGFFTAEEARVELDKNVADDELFEYIQLNLKPHYQIGMLSNAGDNWLNQLFSEEQISLFDKIALSYETGVVKPEPRSFQIIAERLGVEMTECIFVDDQERYCTAAQKQGMVPIWYKNFDQFKEDLAANLKKHK
jgi:HAD superfamily hydrolase (TIGR01509 family)